MAEKPQIGNKDTRARAHPRRRGQRLSHLLMSASATMQIIEVVAFTAAQIPGIECTPLSSFLERAACIPAAFRSIPKKNSKN